MAISVQIPGSIKVLNPVNLDYYRGPWASLAAAKAAVPSGVRLDGLTVQITGSGEYWWLQADLTDTGLIAKNSGGVSLPISDATALLANSSDATKLARFDLSGITTGTQRDLGLPDFSGKLIGNGANLFGSGTSAFQLNANSTYGYDITANHNGSGTANVQVQASSFSLAARSRLYLDGAAITASLQTISPITEQSLSLGGSGGIIVKDYSTTSANQKGLVAFADYSANATNETYITKRYADARLNGLTFTNSPSTNNVPTYNGTNWTFQTPSGGSFTVASLAEAQAGTNNVNGMTPLRVRQVSQKVFNVEAYGAMHDGVFDANGAVTGTDDTAAIQAAINACFAAGGGTVYFPNGVYVISGSLVTSIDGVNPNGQLIIPLTGPFTGVPAPYVKIIFQGESNGSLADGMIGLRGRNTKGVILYSTITGSSTTPSVISASFDAVSYGFNLNQTEVTFKNIEVRVKSMSGAIHQAATMSGINLSYVGSAQVYDCLASIQSPIFTSASQVSAGTYGFIAPIVNNSGNIVFYNTQASGFSVGYLISEHFVGDQMWATGCATGLQVGAGNHVAKIARYFSNGCRYAIDYLAQCPVQIEQFGFERSSHSAWYDAVFDVNNSANSKGVVYYYGFVQGSASDQTITLDGLDAPADFVKINRIHQSFGGGGYAKGNLKHGDYPDSPWLEQNASGDGNFAVLAQTAQQSGTSSLVAIQTVINKQNASGENRLWESRVITNGATNTGLKRESIVTAGSYATGTELSGTLYGINVPTVVGGLSLTNSSAALDIQATTKALILPRVTNTASVVTSSNAMMIYDAALNKFRAYENGAWVNMIGSSSTFVGLTDAPSSYTSQAKKGVRVNGTPNGLEFYTINPARSVTSASAIVQTDENGLVTFNSATPFNFTIDSLLINTVVNFLNKGSATVTFVNGSGVTIVGATTLLGGSNYTATVIYDTATSPIIVTSTAALTNSATNTELMVSNGTNAIGGKIFIPTNGNVTLGDGTLTGNRTITASSSSTNSNIIFVPQGSIGSVQANAFNLSVVQFGTEVINLEPSNRNLYFSSTSPRSSSFLISGSSGNSSKGGDITVRGGVGNGTNQDGGDVFISGGIGTGSGIPGNINIQIASGKLGFFATTAVVQQSVNTILVNNVTSGGTLSTIADFTSLTVYATDAATIRDNFFRLTEKVLKLETALRNYGQVVN